MNTDLIKGDNMKDTLLIIPAYNEELNIREVLQNLRDKGVETILDILVVNDGSKDRTVEIVEEMNIKVISQVYNLGYGAALQMAYKYATQKGYDFVIQMDADGQHDVINIPMIFSMLKEGEIESRPDIVIGSRFLKGSAKYHMSFVRLFAVRMFRGIIKIATKQKITDPTSGLQGLNKKAFEYYSGYQNFDIKYPDINMIIQMLLRGYKIKEFPAVMHTRSQGVAMHTGIIKPIKYMSIMLLSVLVAILRNKGMNKG